MNTLPINVMNAHTTIQKQKIYNSWNLKKILHLLVSIKEADCFSLSSWKRFNLFSELISLACTASFSARVLRNSSVVFFNSSVQKAHKTILSKSNASNNYLYFLFKSIFANHSMKLLKLLKLPLKMLKLPQTFENLSVTKWIKCLPLKR